MLKVNDVLKVNIIELDYKGDGVAKVDDFIIFIPGVLMGEEVTIKVTSVRKRIVNGVSLKLHKKSSDRVSDTSIFGSINLSHLSFKEQLKWQKQITKSTMDKALKEDVNVLDTITDNKEYHYRNKLVFHAVYDPTLKLSLYSNNNQDLTVVDSFILAPKIVNDIVKMINDANINVKDNNIYHIQFKTNRNDDVLVTLISNDKSFIGLTDLTNLLKDVDNVKGMTLNLKKHREHILSDESILLYGKNLLEEGILLANDQSFLQVNTGVANLVYDLIRKNVIGKRIVDAYSGVGSIGFNLYDDNKQITMIDNNKANTKLAKTIKNKNNFDNVEIVHALAEDVINKYQPDTIIVDPPRKGLHERLVTEVINNKIKRVIYLSCNLQSLVRDLRVFNEFYNITKVYPIKMFPQTNSFETLVIMEKR